MKRIISCLLAVPWLLLGQTVSAGETNEAVNAIMQRYTEVEAQLDRAVHYVKKEETVPDLTVQQAWFNRFGGLLKVAMERTSAAGRELKEFFPLDPDEDPAVRRMFVLIRREHPLSNGTTRVEEERLYLQRKSSAPVLTLRKLTKTAEFKAGQLSKYYATLRQPEGRIHFAGEHTSPWNGWMNGGLESGHRVAEEIKARV